MKLNEISKDELELMGYDDIAYIILQESGKKMKLVDIFKKVCKALELPDGTVEAQLLDFFELMSTNKKFVMLENAYWDLQSRHNLDIVIEETDEDEEVIDSVDDSTMDDGCEDEEDIFYEKEDDTEDIVEDDLADLMVVDEEDEQNM